MTAATARTAQVREPVLTSYADPTELKAAVAALRSTGRDVCLVPTMGALHAGHRELIRAARADPASPAIVVSIFVNPLQFGVGEDLDRYPRSMAADLQVCRAERVEVVFAPRVADMYPPGAQTTVDPGRLGAELEGAVRPGHFGGVLTVVAKLFHIVGPDVACFGEKDYQQLVLVRRMARDLDFGVDVVGVPTVREPDGLALSSRNVFLTPEQRHSATALPAALSAGRRAASRGADAVLAAARAELGGDPAVQLDYLELRDPELGPAPAAGPARLLAAVRLGTTRLIDNLPVVLAARE